MIHVLRDLIIGTVIIVALFYGFLVSSVPHAEAGEGCRGQLLRASWYGPESGSRTANGEHFDGSSLTAASRTLPFNTRLRVTYRGKSVVVRVNDRGPFIAGRSIDLSKAAAARIGLIPAGVGTVCVERL
jgi:rare lipoprotein A